MSYPNSVRLKTEQLVTGSQLAHPLYFENELQVLPAGTFITAAIKSQLIERGITYGFLHEVDAAKMSAAGDLSSAAPSTPSPSTSQSATGWANIRQSLSQQSSALSKQVAKLSERVPNKVINLGPPLKARSQRPTSEPYSDQKQQRLVKQYATTKRLMDTMIRHALAGLSQDNHAVAAVSRSTAAELTHDSDQTIAAVAEVSPAPDLTEQAIRLSVLGMAIAMEMNWDEKSVCQVGECGLIHDWGLSRVPEELQKLNAVPSDEERAILAQHPWHTLEMLAHMQQVSEAVQLAVTQVHERLDGSGYPQGLRGEQIHPYAKVLNVADAYISLTEEKWGRPPYLAYDVMVYLLNQVKQESMPSDVVRALLNVISLFPLGSRVRLSDGSEAIVKRRGIGKYNEPVVQRVGPQREIRVDLAHEPLLDLSRTMLKVTSALPDPGRQEARIAADSTIELLW